MNLTSFSRANIPEIRGAVNQALKAVEERYGVTFLLGRITFTNGDWRGKLECKIGSGETIAEDRKAIVAQVGRQLLGSKFDINRTYMHPSEGGMRFVDYKPRKRKYPFVVEQIATGRRIMCSVRLAQALVDNSV